MKVDNVEQFLQSQLMSQIFKNAVGDDGFQVILESLTKSMTDTDGNPFVDFGLGEADLSKIGYGGGEQLVNPFLDDIKSDMSSGNISIDAAVEKASKKYNIDKDLIKAVIQQESSFNPKSTSNAGAMGLMQLMPGTAEDLGVNNPYDIDQNVDGGTKYLKSLLDMYGNSKELALSAYNAGPNALKNKGVDNKDKINRLPYETRDYVNKVMKYYSK